MKINIKYKYIYLLFLSIFFINFTLANDVLSPTPGSEQTIYFPELNNYGTGIGGYHPAKARIFLPENLDTSSSLPFIIYTGGGYSTHPPSNTGNLVGREDFAVITVPFFSLPIGDGTSFANTFLSLEHNFQTQEYIIQEIKNIFPFLSNNPENCARGGFSMGAFLTGDMLSDSIVAPLLTAQCKNFFFFDGGYKKDLVNNVELFNRKNISTFAFYDTAFGAQSFQGNYAENTQFSTTEIRHTWGHNLSALNQIHFKKYLKSKLIDKVSDSYPSIKFNEPGNNSIGIIGEVTKIGIDVFDRDEDLASVRILINGETVHTINSSNGSAINQDFNWIPENEHKGTTYIEIIAIDLNGNISNSTRDAIEIYSPNEYNKLESEHGELSLGHALDDNYFFFASNQSYMISTNAPNQTTNDKITLQTRSLRAGLYRVMVTSNKHLLAPASLKFTINDQENNSLTFLRTDSQYRVLTKQPFLNSRGEEQLIEIQDGVNKIEITWLDSDANIGLDCIELTYVEELSNSTNTIGDFNFDNQLNLEDIDLLQNVIASNVYQEEMDLNQDNKVDIEDRNLFLILAGIANNANEAPYKIADLNFDGMVDMTDFNTWNENRYTNSSDYSKGDINSDGSIDVNDFNIWNSNKFTS